MVARDRHGGWGVGGACQLHKLVSWCFKPRQTQMIISGLRETFIERSIVERTYKAEIRPEEQSEKAESCQENLWNEIQLKGHEDRNRHKNRKGEGKLSCFMSKA